MQKIGKVVKGKKIGYCNSKLHKGYITKKSLKEHKCLEKQCPFLHKFENNEFWVSRRVANIRSKINRYYGNNIENFSISCDYYSTLMKNYYGSWLDVPFDSNGKLDIKDFLDYLERKGMYSSEEMR